MGALTLTNVTKSFGATDVIKGVDLSVNDGEFCVFVGPSGCGKSTLLRMIAGLEDCTDGEIQIDGKRVNEVAPAKRELAMVFQSYALYPHLTVRDNMGLALKQAGFSKADIAKATDRAAGMLALEPLLARRPSELSGGQLKRQRPRADGLHNRLLEGVYRQGRLLLHAKSTQRHGPVRLFAFAHDQQVRNFLRGALTDLLADGFALRRHLGPDVLRTKPINNALAVGLKVIRHRDNLCLDRCQPGRKCPTKVFEQKRHHALVRTERRPMNAVGRVLQTV